MTVFEFCSDNAPHQAMAPGITHAGVAPSYYKSPTPTVTIEIYMYILQHNSGKASETNSDIFFFLLLGMRFPTAPASSTSCSVPTSKIDLVGSPYYKTQTPYFRSPTASANSLTVAGAGNIHTYPTPPPSMSFYPESKCSSAAPASVL